MRRIPHILPVFAFLILELVLFLTNFTPGTFLMGWDNLMPELGIFENLRRAVFGVWLEYRGLGLFDGQSHAAALVHTILAGALSLIGPQSLVRYTVTFGLHALGMIGMLYLVKELLGKNASNHYTGALTALFYGFNPATIQMFYTPFEPFTFHFAALPWIAYGLHGYFQGKKRAWTTLMIIFLLSTPQFFVPTLLIPVAILVAAYAALHMRTDRKRAVLLVVGFVLINAFWLMPYLAGLRSNAPVIADAKINQMSSGDIYARDGAFGDVQNIMLLRGFPLAFEDFDAAGNPVFLMATWKAYLDLPVVTAVGWIFAALAASGLIIVIAGKKKHMIAIPISGVLAFLFLATDAPVAREFNAALRLAFPFLSEGLRVPFTKFILLFTLAYSICAAAAIEAIRSALHKYMSVQQAVVLGLSVGLSILAFPSFAGNFISRDMRVTPPPEYDGLYAYFRDQPLTGRVALLPQPAYWSWKLYQFGYHGSGFMWFGIPQPVLDRAFDPWSKTNENYYWEISDALYAKDAARVSRVFDKYDISYIVLDENILSFGNNRSLFIDETKELLAHIPAIHPAAAFGNISVYEYTGSGKKDFVSIHQNLPTVNAYTSTDNDAAYGQFGEYITGDGGISYPYRSWFTKRSVAERSFDMQPLLASAVPVYDSTESADLDPSHVKACGLLKPGTATGSRVSGALLFESVNQRGCLSFDIPDLSHKSGYVVRVESEHIAGRPLTMSLINDTARHVELEVFLGTGTDYFVLPPRAPDGLGYTVYLSNDAIGQEKTVNILKRVSIYATPYEEITTMHSGSASASRALTNFTVSHPNPALYKVEVEEAGTLVLSQSYDAGWVAFDMTGKQFLPHVLIDNWKNGWILNPDTTGTIYIFFWPQLLEFIGFLLLPVPFMFARKIKK